MATRDARYEVPTWIAGVVIGLVVATAAYVFVYGGSLSTPVMSLAAIFGLALTLFVVYLLYRFVVAVERIADKL